MNHRPNFASLPLYDSRVTQTSLYDINVLLCHTGTTILAAVSGAVGSAPVTQQFLWSIKGNLRNTIIQAFRLREWIR